MLPKTKTVSQIIIKIHFHDLTQVVISLELSPFDIFSDKGYPPLCTFSGQILELCLVSNIFFLPIRFALIFEN